MEISEILILLFCGLLSGAINTLAGGGSLITLPIMIFLGLPPTIANGTNRVQLIFQNIFAVYGFKTKGISNFKFSSYLSISALLGSIIGAYIAIDFNENDFKKLLSIIMILVMFSILLNNKRETLEINKIKNKWPSILIFFFIGIYGGFIHAGVGFLMILTLSKINYLKIAHSNSIKVFVALIFSTAAFLIFLYEGKVNWIYGINIGIGSALGGFFASRWSYNKSDKKFRYFLSLIILIMAIRLWFY
ncbi:MAG: integrase [Flammeovirgaceae bacterium]|nr:integrase [Flammeovirgaceae bacterium]